MLYLTEIHIPDQYKTLVSCDEKYVNQLKLDPGLDLFESTYLCSVQSTNSPHSQDMFDTYLKQKLEKTQKKLKQTERTVINCTLNLN